MLRILLVDDSAVSDHPIRDHFQDAEMRVVSVARTLEEVRLHLRHSDVVLISSDLPDAKKLVRRISRETPDVQVLVTGVEEKAEEIITFVEAGASGYLAREESAEKTVKKVKAAADGDALVSPRMAASLISRVADLSQRAQLTPHTVDDGTACASLTPRQSEVLELIRQELSNRQIANRLHIQVGTVKNHVHHILKKLDVRDRYEAAAAYSHWLKQEGAREAYVTL